MPVLLSCKSASALDSLPRPSNIKRTSSALHRLQQRKKATQSSTEIDASPKPMVERQKSYSNDLQNVLRPKKSSQGLSSNDLPLASSDLYSDGVAVAPVLLPKRETFSEEENGTFSEDEKDDDEKPNRFMQGIRSQSFSPSKANRLSRIITHFDSRPSSPSPLFPSSPRQDMARKRKVVKSMIGDPTNFQHTGHLGASSYNAMQKDDYAEQLQSQLAEVTAALNMEDDNEIVVVKDHCRSEDSSVSGASLASSTSGENSSVYSDSKPSTPIASPLAFHSLGLQHKSNTSTPSSPTQKPGLVRQSSRRKPVPKPRELADLCDIFKNQLPEEEVVPVDSESALLSSPALLSFDQEAEDEDNGIPTIRANNGKRLVPGPAGNLITDTANGRWTCALDEIKLALKTEGETDHPEENEDVADGLRRADEILARLEAL